MVREYGILRLCARRRLDEQQRAALRAAVEADVDWHKLLELADYHRLTGLLLRHLEGSGASIPGETRQQLVLRAESGAHRNLQLTAELIRLVAALAERSIAVLPYKGPLLAVSAWCDLALRPFADLDLLVHPGDAAAASDLLTTLGYTCRYQFNPHQSARFAAVDGDYPFDKGDTLVELHTRITSERFAVPLRTADLFARSDETTIGGQAVRSLAREDLVIVLCLHGCKHRWASLGWVADLAETIGGEAPLDWNTLLVRAEQLGAQRIVLIGLALARDVTGADLPAGVERAIAADTVARKLAAIAQNWLETGRVPGPSGMIRYNYSTLDRSGARVRFVMRWLFNPTPEDFAAVRLPAVLTPFYSLIRPIRLALRYGLDR